MKKLVAAIFILAMVFMAVSVQALEWTSANQATVKWDAVTVPSGTVTYKVYSKPELGTTETLLTTVSTTQATITFTTEGRYFLGVRSVRTVGTVVLESEAIGWSNNVASVKDGITFGYQYYSLPPNVSGLSR